jgi:hypothetical protein
MGIQITESQTANELINQWEKIDYVLEPILDDLPGQYKVFYTNYVKFLIGKDVALANSTPGLMEWSFIAEADNILLLGNYIKLGGEMLEYINRRVAEYLNRKKESLARNAGFLKYYSGSMYTQNVTQKMISDRTESKPSFFSGGGQEHKQPEGGNQI